MCLNKTHLKIARIFNSLSFIYCNKIENFGGFQFVNFKKFFLFEEVGNFRGFRVFDFGLYTEIKNWENSEIFSRPVNLKGFVLFEEVGNFRGFRFSDLALILKSKTRKFFQDM